jgi:tetratricopeptide (TPR) repeat protein
MEQIAQRRGDVGSLVALMLGGEDVSAYDHLRAAEALEDAGRLRDATALLERAARQFDDDRLLLKLEQNYRRDGCDADADALLWRRFEQRPRRESFAQLLTAAGKRWPDWRDRAYAAIAAVEAADLGQAKKWQRDAVADPGLRLACLVEEGRIDEAAGLAESQPLPIRTLDAALRLLADKRPETAFHLLHRWLPHALRDSGISHYQRVGDMLLDVGRHQPAVRFASFLAQLRAEQARRPRLVEILDGVARQLAGAPVGRPDRRA